MSRHATTQAIVLRSHRIGEIHKGVTLLTVDRGIVSAIAHGALKARSRLRSVTETFCHSRVYLYFDPVKGSCKITDMTPLAFFEGLRRSLRRYFAASLWIEVIMKSMAAGESDDRVFELFRGCLAALEEAEEEGTERLVVQFLWRFLRLSGHAADIAECGSCGRHLEVDECLYTDRYHAGFVCADCAGGGCAALNAGARRYLSRTSRLPLLQALRASPDRPSLVRLEVLLLELMQSVLETPLNSLPYVKGSA